MARDIAIVLNSGSMNSAVVTALAAQRYRVVMLHAEITEPGSSRLRAAYDQQVDHFKPHREHAMPMNFLSGIASTASLGSTVVDTRQESARAMQLLALLPLIGSAARFAAHYQAAAIYTGLRVGPGGDELAQATEFTQICNELIQLPCKQPEVELVMPILELEPWQVVDLGFQVAAPLEKSWSCSTEANDPCWSCPGCRSREAAFNQAVKADPLKTPRKT